MKVTLFGCTHPHSKAHLKTLLLSERISDVHVYDETVVQ